MRFTGFCSYLSLSIDEYPETPIRRTDISLKQAFPSVPRIECLVIVRAAFLVSSGYFGLIRV